MKLWGMGNGEWGAGNGGRGTGNRERGAGNGGRGTGSGEQGTGNGERGGTSSRRFPPRPGSSPIPLTAALARAIALLACLTACASGPVEMRRDNRAYGATRPDAAVRDELTVAWSSGEEAAELDFRRSYLANEAQLYTALYEGLFSYHPFTMKPVPAACEDWELSDDKKQWTFTLRRNARYWNGDPLRAEDFKASWLSLLAPGRDSPYSSLFDIIEGARDYRLGRKAASAVGVTAPNARTLVVKLSSPASFFPSMLCHHSFSPIHPSMLKADDWSLSPPLSNGPFRLESMDGAGIVLIKNDAYWDAGRVALRKIFLKYTDDGEEAASLWNSGEARWITGAVNADALTDRSGIQVNSMFATHYYYIRSGEKPWNDYRVRRALSLALPWEKIRSIYVLPADTLIYPLPGYPGVKGVDVEDPEAALELLREAGYPGGKGLPEILIRLNPSADAGRIGAMMALAWTNMGLKVKIDVVPYGQYFDSMKKKDYVVGSSTWIGDFADPYTFLQMWRRDSNLNDAGYDDEDYETLMEKSMGEEGEDRWATLAEAETLLLDRGAVLPVYYTPAVNIINTDEIGGWYKNALDIHPFKYLEFKSYRPLPGVAGLEAPPRGNRPEA